MTKKKISIVTPCFNEEDNVIPLYKEIKSIFSKLAYDYEHIFIDNCSTDNTVKNLRKLASSDPKIKVIINARNFGTDNSTFYGILQSSGDACIMLPSDFQVPPILINEFLKQWEKGSKIVLSVRKRSEISCMSNFFRKTYYRFINKISTIKLVKDSTGSGLYDSEVVKILRSIDDPMPFFRGLLCEVGFPIASVFYTHKQRLHGKTSYSLMTLIDAAFLGVIKHSRLPLRFFTIIGTLTSFLSFFVALFYLFLKLFFWDTFDLGIAPIIIGLFFISGIQLLGLGLIGEYLGVTFTHVRKFPIVIESERINF